MNKLQLIRGFETLSIILTAALCGIQWYTLHGEVHINVQSEAYVSTLSVETKFSIKWPVNACAVIYFIENVVNMKISHHAVDRKYTRRLKM